MYNLRVIDKVGMPHVMLFITEKLAEFDTKSVEWIKLLPLKKNTLLHGECKFPYKGATKNSKLDSGYRIRASVNVMMCPPFSFAHWGREYFDTANIAWKSVEKKFYFEDLEECAVHTLAHECFHFLSDSGQVKEKNYEANANWWGDLWLTEFKNNR